MPAKTKQKNISHTKEENKLMKFKQKNKKYIKYRTQKQID